VTAAIYLLSVPFPHPERVSRSPESSEEEESRADVFGGVICLVCLLFRITPEKIGREIFRHGHAFGVAGSR